MTAQILPLQRPAKRRRRSKPAQRSVDWITAVHVEPLSVKSLSAWRYQWHEMVIRVPDLNGGDLSVAAALMHGFDVRRGFAEIGQALIAQRTNRSRSVVQRALNRLRCLGLIDVANEGKRRHDLTRETNRYRLICRARGVL